MRYYLKFLNPVDLNWLPSDHSRVNNVPIIGQRAEITVSHKQEQKPYIIQQKFKIQDPTECSYHSDQHDSMQIQRNSLPVNTALF